ncbi:MAG: hypothetical protein LCI00_03945 [Chloroflexi bacterium]|nr:hypothetical protein [Chloroflexota bacterium]MCC6891225.1 hypothetical protein [Anaerolineae bacterium]
MMNRYLAIFSLIFLSQLVKTNAVNSAYFTTDHPNPLIGQPVTLILHVVVPQNTQIILPDVAAEWAGVTVTQVGDLITANQLGDGSTEYVAPITIILWQTGQVTMPPLTVLYQVAGSDPLSLITESFSFTVPETLTANDLALRPSRPQIGVFYVPIWIIITLCIVICFVPLLWFLRRHYAFNAGRTNLTTPAYTPAAEALVTLKKLVAVETYPTVIYQMSAFSLRNYINARWLPQSLDLTTNELMLQLKKERTLTEPNLQSLSEMLRFADLVKFSKVSPDLKDGHQFASSAAEWIHAVDENVV